jgi:hypothetical protein
MRCEACTCIASWINFIGRPRLRSFGSDWRISNAGSTMGWTVMISGFGRKFSVWLRNACLRFSAARARKPSDCVSHHPSLVLCRKNPDSRSSLPRNERRATAAYPARGCRRHRREGFRRDGSQAILGSHPDAPRSLRKSVEGDTYPKNHPHKAIEVDGAIGELSPFHHEFGYYAHGVAPDSATLPDGWEQRLVEFQVNDPSGTIGLCLEKHDLAFSKLAAGREKTSNSFVNCSNTGLSTEANSAA